MMRKRFGLRRLAGRVMINFKMSFNDLLNQKIIRSFSGTASSLAYTATVVSEKATEKTYDLRFFLTSINVLPKHRF